METEDTGKIKNRFEKIMSDSPYEKPVSTGLFNYDSKLGRMEIQINIEEGWVNVDGVDRAKTQSVTPYEWILSDGDEKVLQYTSHTGEEIQLNLPYGVIKGIESKERALSEWKEKSKEWLKQLELELLVDVHEYQSKGRRTEYDSSKKVLKPNKTEIYMTEEESSVYNQLKDNGTADGFPVASEDHDEGTIIKYTQLNI